MHKSKQTPRDKRGGRKKRNPRDTSPQHKRASHEPPDDLYEESDGAVDREMEFDTDRYELPFVKP